MSFSALTEGRIRTIQSAAAARTAKREEAAAKHEAREVETRQTISPNDLLARERHKAVCDYYIGLYEQKRERERQERIAEANPKLIAWKTEYMQDKTTPSRRAALVSQFVELYRQAYRKDGNCLAP